MKLCDYLYGNEFHQIETRIKRKDWVLDLVGGRCPHLPQVERGRAHVEMCRAQNNIEGAGIMVARGMSEPKWVSATGLMTRVVAR